MQRQLQAEWWRQPAKPQSVRLHGPTVTETTGGEVAFAALVAFTVVLVLAPQQFFPILGKFRIAFVIAGVAIAAHLLSGFAARARLGVPTEVKLVVALLVLAVLGIPMAIWPGGALATLTDQYLKSVAIFWLLGQVVCTVGRMRLLTWTIAIASVPLALTGLYNFAFGVFVRERIIGYSSGLATNPNDLALTLNLFIPLTAALGLSTRRPSLRLLAWVVVGLSAVAVVVTFSRGGFLTLVAEGALLLVLLVRRGAAKIVGMIILCGGLALVSLPGGYAQRISTIMAVNSDPTGSSQVRARDIIAAGKVILANPIVGSGVGMDHLALNEARGAFWSRVHNTYLSYGVDLGVVGMVLFVALLITCLRSARRIERLGRVEAGAELPLFAGGIRISLAGFMIAALFYPVPYHFYFYYIAGLSVALKTIAALQFGMSVRA